jgi:hypothetical protein
VVALQTLVQEHRLAAPPARRSFDVEAFEALYLPLVVMS